MPMAAWEKGLSQISRHVCSANNLPFVKDLPSLQL